jgi:hypothetical protein
LVKCRNTDDVSYVLKLVNLEEGGAIKIGKEGNLGPWSWEEEE